MRLLELNEDGSFRPTWFSGSKVPPYAILSHTWGTGEDDEVTFEDITNGSGTNKAGFQKLLFCGNQAKHDDLHYFWVDTCCINKADLGEHTTAINSMFRWYKNAAKCYVYLLDVSVYATDGKPQVEWQPVFCNSRWFTRGWTLQELLAPKVVEFFSRDKTRLGDKRSLERQISEITGIPLEALRGDVGTLSNFSIEERLLWVKERQTTREEDKAYCLLGIFDVFLPLIYGEGQSSAMRRLRKEIRDSENKERQSINIRPPSYNIPFPRNRRFIGRSTILEELKQRLFVNKDTQTVALAGLGGIGKTQTALEFAYRVKEDQPDYSIFWIPALSMESMEQVCSEIAKIRKIPHVIDDDEDIKELIRQYLSSDVSGK